MIQLKFLAIGPHKLKQIPVDKFSGQGFKRRRDMIGQGNRCLRKVDHTVVVGIGVSSGESSIGTSKGTVVIGESGVQGKGT